MKKILAVSGSSRPGSSNVRFLKAMDGIYPKLEFSYCDMIADLPLFQPQLDTNPLPTSVKNWRGQIDAADIIIICTPEYIHNMPALIKNALEWLTTSGNLSSKSVIALTLTPHEPRGEKAMNSLLWSLMALDAQVKLQASYYLNELEWDGDNLAGDALDSVKVLLDTIQEV